jgi:hypothetical protein
MLGEMATVCVTVAAALRLNLPVRLTPPVRTPSPGVEKTKLEYVAGS